MNSNLVREIKLAKKYTKSGRSEEARHIYEKILTQFPYNKAARTALNKLLQSIPLQTVSPAEVPPAQINQLKDLYQKNMFELVISGVDKLAKSYSNSDHLWNLKGASYLGLKKFEAAIVCFKNGLELNPNYAVMHNNLGNALIATGQRAAALQSYEKAFKIDPNFVEAGKNLAFHLKGLVFAQPNSDMKNALLSLLAIKKSVRPMSIARAAISLIKLEPSLEKILHFKRKDAQNISWVEVASELADLPLLIKLMSVSVIPDLSLEKILIEIRRNLLLTLDGVKETKKINRFQSALAHLCFNNEYVYTQSKDESKVLDSLIGTIESILLSGAQPSPKSILCLASYTPLYKYDWSKLLSSNIYIDEIFTRQVVEPGIEARLKKNMIILSEITDEVSTSVRKQYEENPYPRWVDLELPAAPASIAEIVKGKKIKLFDFNICQVESPSILIAGCGTGQHSIGSAATYDKSQVLAVDLSLSSLAHAQRKTKELDINNVEYMQADILKLGELGQKFDLIESSGVLHHMDDPIAGWRSLARCLKNGGLMRIGLYSQLARRHIEKIQGEIFQKKIAKEGEEIKLLRQELINSSEVHHEKISKNADFYSLSTVRDLLFNVQEHRFELLQIRDYLEAIGLKFCGFELENIPEFDKSYILESDRYDLEKWDEYERENPDTFASMYQFWCQKIS